MSEPSLAFVGSYTSLAGNGILAFRFSSESGSFERLGPRAEIANPSYLCIDPSMQILYGVKETAGGSNEEGEICSYRINGESGELSRLNEIASGGIGPCYLSLDKHSHTLFAANYHSGSVVSIRLKSNGSLGETISRIELSGSSSHPERQCSSHPHAILTTPDNRYVLVTDLGADSLRVFSFDPETSRIFEMSQFDRSFGNGFGPRHFAIHPRGRFLYVIHEISSQVTVHRLGGEEIIGSPIQTVVAHTSGLNEIADAADIAIDSSGSYLYVSTRRTSSLRTFSIDLTSGYLDYVEDTPSGGASPHAITLVDDTPWLVAANLQSNNLTIFRRLPTGKLLLSHRVSVPSPSCIRFI